MNCSISRVEGIDIYERNTIRLTPYRRRHSGLTGGEVHELKAFISQVKQYCAQLPLGGVRNAVIFFLFGLYAIVLGIYLVQREEVSPVNQKNRNRQFDSFTDEECWHQLRFRKAELAQLFILCNFPAIVVCKNGTTCPGEHAFALMLHRMAYPSKSIAGHTWERLFTIIENF